MAGFFGVICSNIIHISNLHYVIKEIYDIKHMWYFLDCKGALDVFVLMSMKSIEISSVIVTV